MPRYTSFPTYGLVAILTKKIQQDSQSLQCQTDQQSCSYTQTYKHFKFYVKDVIPIKQKAKLIPYLYSHLKISNLHFEVDQYNLTEDQKRSQIRQIFPIFIDIVQKNFRFVIRLGFQKIYLDDQLLKKIEQCNWKFLTSLTLSFNKISHQGIKFLSQINLKRLKQLDLGYNNLGNLGIINIYKCHFPNLNKLDIRSTNITSDVIKVIEKYFNKLEILALGFGQMIDLLFSVRKLFKTSYKQIYVLNDYTYIFNDVCSFWHFSNLIVKSPHFTQNLQSNKHRRRLQQKNHSLWIRSFMKLQMKQKIKIGSWMPEFHVW